MTRLSRKPISPREFGRYINNLWTAFTLIDSKNDIRSLFRDLFTHTEYKMFAKRLEIASRLLNGETYEDIVKDLRVTMGTISSVSNSLARGGEGYRAAHRELALLNKTKNVNKNRKPARPRMPGSSVLKELVSGGIKVVARVSRRRSRRKSASEEFEV